MKKFAAIIALCLVSYLFGKYSQPNVSVAVSPPSSSPRSAMPSTGGDAEYRIEFTGKTGAKFSGTYAFQPASSEQNRTGRVERVESELPKTISFKSLKSSPIVASGNSYPDRVETKIYRDGVECGKPSYVSSTAPSNTQVCNGS
jgi:hypothetical protein